MVSIRARRSFGALRRLPSKRWQASFTGIDLKRHTSPRTFATKTDAEGWLAAERRLMDAGRWTPPAQRLVDAQPGDELTLSDWATSWMAERQLRDTTRDG